MGGGLQGSSKEEGAKGDQGPTVVRGEFPVSRGGCRVGKFHGGMYVCLPVCCMGIGGIFFIRDYYLGSVVGFVFSVMSHADRSLRFLSRGRLFVVGVF